MCYISIPNYKNSHFDNINLLEDFFIFMNRQVWLINHSIQAVLTEEPLRYDGKHTAGTKLGQDMAQQTTAVRKQMLFMYLPNFSLCAFCSCLTVKSFKTNKQMVTDYTEATASSAERSSRKLAYNWWAKFTLWILSFIARRSFSIPLHGISPLLTLSQKLLNPSGNNCWSPVWPLTPWKRPKTTLNSENALACNYRQATKS